MLEAENKATLADDAPRAVGGIEQRQRKAFLKADTLGDAILTSVHFPIIATDEKGIIQLFNAGAERMLGYSAAEVVNRISPSDIHDPQEVAARARELSIEFAHTITPGFEALAFKASRGIEDVYELTYISKDGSRFPAVVSITALRADHGEIIGYLLIGSDNSARKRAESDLIAAMAAAEQANRVLEQTVQDRTAEICESEARYRSLIELASDWYWEQDENGSFTRVSGPVLEMLGIRVPALAGDTGATQVTGWNEAERAALQTTIAARQPFLDFVFSRANADGSRQKFQVSGEPMFNQSCRFIGYRGIGVELTAKK